MFTVVPREEAIIHPPQTEIIDHNVPAKVQGSTWKKGKKSSNVPYDTLQKERDKLAEAERKYRARIKELESENAELSKTYDKTYQENKMLKGILQHGPDATKVKVLMKEKKELKSTIDRLEEANEALTKRLNEIEQMYDAKDQILDNTWNEALANAKKKRPDEEKVPTQGPFAGHTKSNEKTINNQLKEMDEFDVHLDNLEKETQILLNKIHQLQNEKDHIGTAINKEKGYITRNAAMNNALNEKLNRDLDKFANKLEKLKLKHKAAKTGNVGKGKKHAFKGNLNDTEDNEIVSSVTPSGQANNTLRSATKAHQSVSVKPFEQQPVNQSPRKELAVNNKAISDQRPKTGDQLVSNKVKPTPRLNKTEDGHRENNKSSAISNGESNNNVHIKINNLSRSVNLNGVSMNTPKPVKKTVITFSPDIISKPDYKSRNILKVSNKTFETPIEERASGGLTSNDVPKKLDNDALTGVSNGFQEKTDRNEKSDKECGDEGNTSTSNNLKKIKNADASQANTDKNKRAIQQVSKTNPNGNGSVTNGRYAHGPEPVNHKITGPMEKKPSRYTDLYNKRKAKSPNANTSQERESGLQLTFTDKIKYRVEQFDQDSEFNTARTLHRYGFPVHRNSKHLLDDVPNDAVLTYLKNRPHANENAVSFNQNYADAKEKVLPSPIPIRFTDDAKTVGSDEVHFILNAKRHSYNSIYA